MQNRYKLCSSAAAFADLVPLFLMHCASSSMILCVDLAEKILPRIDLNLAKITYRYHLLFSPRSGSWSFSVSL